MLFRGYLRREFGQLVSILRDGRSAETASYNPNDEEFEKRLGAMVKRGATTIIIDNAKGRGSRNPRIDSACLERSITDPILSFRLLGASKEIRAENSHLFCITANSPEVSPDLVSRSVVVNLFFEGSPKRRRFALIDPDGYALQHRTELLGELIGMVERWRTAGSPEADVETRFNKKGWGRIVGGILQVAGLPDFLANAEAAAEELDESRAEFTELVQVMAVQPGRPWTAGELVEAAVGLRLFRWELEDATPRARTTWVGMKAACYVYELFTLEPHGTFVFKRIETRRGNAYRIEVLSPGPVQSTDSSNR